MLSRCFFVGVDRAELQLNVFWVAKDGHHGKHCVAGEVFGCHGGTFEPVPPCDKDIAPL